MSAPTDPKESLERAFNAIQEMWERRYDTDDSKILDTREGESFGCPVAVDIGQLAVAQSEIVMVARYVHPELYHRWRKERHGRED